MIGDTQILHELRQHRLTRRRVLQLAARTAAFSTVAGLLAACGGDDDDSDPTEEQDGGPSSTTPAETTEPAGSDASPEPGEPMDEDESAGVFGGTLTVGSLGDFDYGSLDITTTTGTHDLDMIRSINDAYIWLLPDGSFGPGLAESWEISDDGLAYTFKLREDVIFHDGDPLNADAVKFNFDRMTNRETNPSGLSYSYLGAGVSYVDTVVVDPYTFRIDLSEPNATFLLRMRRHMMSPQSPAALEQYGDEYFRNPVSCGPFKFVEWVEGDHLTLEAFEEYNWGSPQIFENPGRPYVDQLIFRIFNDLSIKAIALESGEVDYAARLFEEDIARFQADGDFEVLIRNQMGQSTNLGLNTEKFPTDDINVRKAIGWAVDRVGLVESLFFGLLEPATHLFTTDLWSYDASLEGLFGYDPDQANQILDEAGWVMEGDVRVKDGQELRCVWILGQETASVGQFVQADLAKIGIAVDLQILAGAGLIEATLRGDHNISGGTGGWVNEDPDVVRSWAHSSLIDVRQNPIRVRDPELDALVDAGIAFVGDHHSPEREEIYQQIQAEIMENAYVIPLYYRRGFEAYNPRVKFNEHSLASFDPFGSYHNWGDVWIEE